MESEIKLLVRLGQHDVKAFKVLVWDYSESMIIYARLLLTEQEQYSLTAEEVVDTVLFKLWNEGDFPPATLPLHTFLYQEVEKECCMRGESSLFFQLHDCLFIKPNQ